MKSQFGRFAAKLRETKGQTLAQMADILSISDDRLSLIENDKSKPSIEWIDILSQEYSLNAEEQEKLRKAILNSSTCCEKSKNINISNLNIEDQEIILLFVRKLSTIPEKDKNWLKHKLKALTFRYKDSI